MAVTCLFRTATKQRRCALSDTLSARVLWDVSSMDKSKIVSAVQSLLSSAQDRGTDQGVLVYTSVLDLLDRATVDAEIRDILGKLNRSLTGIEAHGHFTDEEFCVVQFLRSSD